MKYIHITPEARAAIKRAASHPLKSQERYHAVTDTWVIPVDDEVFAHLEERSKSYGLSLSDTILRLCQRSDT